MTRLLATLREGSLSRLLPLVLIIGLSGCAAFDRSLVTMAVNHNDTIDQIDRNTVLLNILRASDEQPLSFTTVSYLGGNGSIGAGGSLNESRSTWHGLVTGASEGLFFNVNKGFGYSLSVLDNEQFMRTFLAGIPLDKLLFLSEGIYLSNDVLWTLLTDSVSFQSANGVTSTFPNSIEPSAWSSFQRVMSRAARLGLALEQIPNLVPVGPALSRDEAMMHLSGVISAWNGTAYGPPNAGSARPVLVETAPGTSLNTHQLMMQSDKARFCFNPKDIAEWRYTETDLLCKQTGAFDAFQRLRAQQQSEGRAPSLEPLNWRSLDIRSPREVFYFLGRVIRAQMEDPGRVFLVTDSTASTDGAGRPLLRVVCNSSSVSDDQLAVANYRGRICFIPRGDDSHSAQVLQYLSLLVTLSKVPGSVTPSPSVLVR